VSSSMTPGRFPQMDDKIQMLNKARSTGELLKAYCDILDELRARGITRSTNNPVSDYAELLFCQAFGWTRTEKSAAGYDATDEKALRYQIKARRVTPQSASRQLGAIRQLDKDPFDYLAGVLMDKDFKIVRAAIIPVSVVRKNSKHVAHTNSWRFLLRDNVWDLRGVRDVSAEVAEAAMQLNLLAFQRNQDADDGLN